MLGQSTQFFRKRRCATCERRRDFGAPYYSACMPNCPANDQPGVLSKCAASEPPGSGRRAASAPHPSPKSTLCACAGITSATVSLCSTRGEGRMRQHAGITRDDARIQRIRGGCMDMRAGLSIPHLAMEEHLTSAPLGACCCLPAQPPHQRDM